MSLSLRGLSSGECYSRPLGQWAIKRDRSLWRAERQTPGKGLLAKPCSQKGEANTLAGLVSGLYQAWQTCSNSLRSLSACFQWNKSVPLPIHVCCGRVKQTRYRSHMKGFSSFNYVIRCAIHLLCYQNNLRHTKVLKLNFNLLFFDQQTDVSWLFGTEVSVCK